MRISVVGKNEKVSKEEFRFATKFFASFLMKKQINEDLYIDIINEKSKQFSGYTVNIESDLRRKPRNFEIYIDPTSSKRQILLTLAHEMVHVKQYATGELRYKQCREIARWKGISHDANMNYLEKPWEVEAYNFESGMLDAYIQYKKLLKMKF